MEKTERQISNKTIYRRGIEVGIVSHIQELEKGVLPNQKGNFEIIDESVSRQIVAFNLRKIAFVEREGQGCDIFYKLSRNNPYCYEIINDDNANFKHNSLVIRYASHMDELLAYAGYSIKISSLDLKELKKLFLTKDNALHVISHDVKLPSLINPSIIEAINQEAHNLSEFKEIDLQTKPLAKEKVYAKHFK